MDELHVDSWLKSHPALKDRKDISIVVPAYNEERRLPSTLIDIIDYFDQSGLNYEVIVVDDGSRDSTSQVIEKFVRIRPRVKRIRLPKNYGKGHAVRTGVLNADGSMILFCDADGATPIEEFQRLRDALTTETPIVIGSRAKRSTETIVKTNWLRKGLGRIFSRIVNTVLLPGYADTQCGFKLFYRLPAMYIFGLQSSDGFSFDLELLLIAKKCGISVKELPVNWTNIPGSKVNLIRDSLIMFIDIFRYRLRHTSLSPHHYQKWAESLESSL